MARDWRWRKASFDGARFYVDVQELRGGRRLVVHEYAGGESHDVEDLGRKAGGMELTAYFLSETSDMDSAALMARLSRGGAGLLQIPMFGAVRMVAQNWEPSWTRQSLNYVGFRISFVEEGSALAPVPLGLGAAELGVMSAGLGGVLGAAVSGLVAPEPSSSFIRADMLAKTRELVAQVETFRAATPLPERVDADLKTDLADAVKAASNPASNPGQVVSDALAALDTVATESSGDMAAPITLLDDLVAGALADRKATLARWGVSEMVSIIPLAGAVAFAAQAARLRAVRDYRDRQSAQAARTQIAVAAALLTDVYAPLGIEPIVAFDEIIGKAARHLSSRIPNLAPVVIVQTGVSLPSSVLAYRLYGDVTRARELVDRNFVATPCFMPTKFEASNR